MQIQLSIRWINAFTNEDNKIYGYLQKLNHETIEDYKKLNKNIHKYIFNNLPPD